MYCQCSTVHSMVTFIVVSDIRQSRRLIEYYNNETQKYDIKHVQDEGGE